MEEKERYELIGYCSYRDTETGVISDNFVGVLNEQDQKIKDLEAKLAESEKLTERLQQIVDKLRDKEFAGKTLVEAVNAVYEPLYKNKYDEAEELKHQLHDLSKKIVEEIRTYCNLKEFNPEFVDKEHQECIVSYTELIDFLDTILKKYGGEDESNND